MLESELVPIREPTTIHTSPYTPKNDTSPENADAIAEPTTQIVQIPTAKISEIVFVKVNTNN
jgi:hypothetical protein